LLSMNSVTTHTDDVTGTGDRGGVGEAVHTPHTNTPTSPATTSTTSPPVRTVECERTA
jgi:hypothetical protein